MADEIRDNIRNRRVWLRLFYLALFAVILNIASALFGALVVIQFGFVLLGGTANANLKRFGRSLARFIADVVLYMTFNTDDRPFPFSDWPPADPPAAAAPRGRTSRSRSTRARNARRPTGRSRAGATTGEGAGEETRSPPAEDEPSGGNPGD